MLTSIFSNETASVELYSIFLCSVCSILLGICIAFTHKYTSKYNKNFLVTLSVLPLLVQIVFFAMTIGLATGMGHLLFAGIMTCMGCAILLLLSKAKFFDPNRQEKILKITIPENLDYTTVFDTIFDQYTCHTPILWRRLFSLETKP